MALVSNEHADAVLELAYLMTAADGRLGDDEIEAYRDVIEKVRGKAPSNADLDTLLDRFAGNVDHAEITERVTVLSRALPPDVRETAFKLALQLSLADLDTSREEEAIQAVMIEAMGLSAERAEALTAEVYGAFDAGADE